MRNFANSPLIYLLVIFVIGCSSHIQNLNDPNRLCEIEQQYKSVIVKVNDSSVANYSQLFLDKNPHIISYFEGLQQEKSKNVHFTYLYAEAGYGKSSIIKPLIQTYLQDDYGFISLKKDVIEEVELFKISMKCDVALSSQEDDICLNKLPYFEVNTAFLDSLLSFVTTEHGTLPSCIVLDDFDEIHPESALNLIDKLYDYLTLSAPHTQIIILGRPEAYWELHQANILSDKITGLGLTPIQIDNEDKLKLRIKYHIDANYAFTYPKPNSEEVFESILLKTKEYPSLAYTLTNNHVGSIAIENIDSSQNYYDVMVAEILNRAMYKHNRPANQEKLTYQIYLKLLSKIAYESIATISNEGYFSLNHSAKTSIHYEGKTYTVNSYDILARSGLIQCEPSQKQELSIKFIPFWLHKYFAELHLNENLTVRETLCN